MPDAPAAPTGAQTALVAVGQGSLMAFGALLALLIAQLFGKDLETDAFFAAYGVYAFGITFTQSFRLAAVPQLVLGDGAGSVTREIGAAIVMALAIAVPLAVAAPLLGDVLVETDPDDVARDTLRILSFALAAQLVAAMLAAVLAVRGAFKAIGLATLLVGVVTTATFLLTERAFGILAAAVGLAVGGAWLVAVLAAVLFRDGWRPHEASLRAFRAIWAEAGRLTFSSVIFVSQSLMYVISVALAARQGSGEATLFAYAYVLVSILLGLTANVAGMLRSPRIVASPDRTAEVAEVGLWSFRFTVVLAGPPLALLLLGGEPLIGLVLGSEFSGGSASGMLTTVACLVGWLIASAAGLFATIELLAAGELRRLALIAAVQVLVLVPAALVGAQVAGIQGIGVALSLATLVGTGMQLRYAFGPAARDAGARLAQAVGRELLVLASAFAVPATAVLAFGDSTAVIVISALLGACLVAAATAIAWPREARALLALLPSRR